MIVSLSWIKEFLPDLSWQVEELSEKLGAIGHEADVVDPDTIDVSVTPNRGDCTSIYGLARDIAGIYNLKFREPETFQLPTVEQFIPLEVTENAQQEVYRDLLVKIENYTPTNSSSEIEKKIKLLGLQTKDLAIDLTNLVSHELGVPLHVFDLTNISTGLKFSKTAKKEVVTLLDNSVKEIPAGTLIQVSNNQIVDLVGVMGTKNSSVTNHTTALVLQSGVFKPSQIRFNSEVSNIKTSASWRYQRGVDGALAEKAAARFAYLLSINLPTVKISAVQNLQNMRKIQTVPTDLSRISRLTGVTFTQSDLNELSKLDFEVHDNEVIPPTWRYDIESQADVAEELLRLKGYDKLFGKKLSHESQIFGTYEQIAALKWQLVALGFSEVKTYSFTNEQTPMGLRNSASESKFLRNSLRNGLLESAARNPYLNKLLLFEVGAVFKPVESLMLGFLFVGHKEKAVGDIVDQISSLLGLSVEPTLIEEVELKKSNVKQTRVWFIEVELAKVNLPKAEPLRLHAVHLPKYRKVSKFPPIVRDVTLVVDEEMEAKELAMKLGTIKYAFLVELTDVFRSETIGENKQALTIRIIFQDIDRSLVDDDVNNSLSEGLRELSKTVQFQVR